MSPGVVNASLPEKQGERMPRIMMVGVGGTISGECSDPVKGGSFYVAGKRTVQELGASIPGLQDLADIEFEQFANVPSTSVDTALWIHLAKRINSLLNDEGYDGVVVTHGTDTMEETAYFLNLTVKSSKPVVLVGSMRPSNAISADGPKNIVDAVIVASSPDACGKGVLVVMNGKIHAAREVTKTDTLAVETFAAHDLGCLGYVVENKPRFYRISTRRHTMDSEFDVNAIVNPARVAILYGSADQDTMLVETAVKMFDGIVQAGTGNGSISAKIQVILDYNVMQTGLPVVRSSRTGSGVITHKPMFSQSKFILGDNLNPQKARILLILALSITTDFDKIQRIFDLY